MVACFKKGIHYNIVIQWNTFKPDTNSEENKMSDLQFKKGFIFQQMKLLESADGRLIYLWNIVSKTPLTVFKLCFEILIDTFIPISDNSSFYRNTHVCKLGIDGVPV